MQRLIPLIESAQHRLARLLSASLEQWPLTPQLYQRYLSVQFHLTKGVQRHYMAAAAHQDMVHLAALRRSLIGFAAKEGAHYMVAGNDLQKLGLDLMPEPFDVTLWHAYFEKIVIERPFVRLGAAWVVENILAGAVRPLIEQALSAPFLSEDNTRFLALQLREKSPQADPIMDALNQAGLFDCQLNDLAEGARKGTVLYLRMVEWALDKYSVANFANIARLHLNDHNLARVARFELSDQAELDQIAEIEIDKHWVRPA